MRFEMYQDVKREWRWRLWSENNRIIADSGEGYKRREDCAYGVALVVSTNTNTPVEG